MTNLRYSFYFLLIVTLLSTNYTYGQESSHETEGDVVSTPSEIEAWRGAYHIALTNKDSLEIFNNAFRLKKYFSNIQNFDSTYVYNEILIANALAVKNIVAFIDGHHDNNFMDIMMYRNFPKAAERLAIIKPYLHLEHVPLESNYQIAETLALNYNQSGDLDSTIYYAKLAVSLSNKLDQNHIYRVTSRIQLSKYLEAMGEGAQSVLFLIEVEALIEKEVDRPMQKLIFYQLLSMAFLDLNDIAKSEYYLSKYKTLVHQKKYQSFNPKTLKLEGKIENAKGNTDQAIGKYKSALKLSKNGMYKLEQLDLWVFLGQLYFEKNDLNTMKVYLDSLKLNFSDINERTKADWHQLNLKYQLKNNNLKSAKNSLDFLNDFNKKPSTNRLSIAYVNYLYDQHTGNKANELKSFKKYTHLKDSLNKIANSIQATRIESEFNRKKQNIEIKALTEATDAKDKALSFKNNSLILGGFLLALLAVSFIALYRLYKQNRKQTKNISLALEENQTLLKEIHHRVRNNLQVISSLLSMQARKIDDSDVKDVLNSSRSRVQSISILHQNLYSGTNANNLAVDDYFDLLLKNILAMFNIEKDITCDVSIDDIAFDIDVMVPLGLIANELITNSLKHAFVGRKQGKLAVLLKEKGNQFIFKVSDDGIGFEGHDLPVKEGSIGARLIKSFTKKLKGTIEITHNIGTEITITFDKRVLKNG